MSKISAKLYSLHELVDFSLLTGTLLGVCGTYWDIQYHIDYGRDSFWIAPHLMVYLGVVIIFFGAVLALWNVRKIYGQAIQLKKPLLAILFSALLQISAAPIDDLWHRIFGLDVTVWSPPHVLLLLAGFLIALSFVYFQRQYMHLTRLDRARRLLPDELKLELMFAIALVGLNIFVAEYEYFRTIPLYHISHSRPAWFYFLILTAQFSFIFALAKTLVGGKWTITRIAVMYFVIRSLLSLVLMSGSWPIFPPLIIVSAIVFDLAARFANLKNIFVAAILFAISFYLAQIFYMAAFKILKFIPADWEIFAGMLAAMIFAYFGFFTGRKLRATLA